MLLSIQLIFGNIFNLAVCEDRRDIINNENISVGRIMAPVALNTVSSPSVTKQSL